MLVAGVVFLGIIVVPAFVPLGHTIWIWCRRLRQCVRSSCCQVAPSGVWLHACSLGGWGYHGRRRLVRQHLQRSVLSPICAVSQRYDAKIRLIDKNPNRVASAKFYLTLARLWQVDIARKTSLLKYNKSQGCMWFNCYHWHIATVGSTSQLAWHEPIEVSEHNSLTVN